MIYLAIKLIIEKHDVVEGIPSQYDMLYCFDGIKKENELIIGLLPAFNLIKIHIFPKEGYVCALWIFTILKNQRDCLFKPDWV